MNQLIIFEYELNNTTMSKGLDKKKEDKKKSEKTLKEKREEKKQKKGRY